MREEDLMQKIEKIIAETSGCTESSKKVSTQAKAFGYTNRVKFAAQLVFAFLLLPYCLQHLTPVCNGLVT
jgi:hypothetical protein